MQDIAADLLQLLGERHIRQHGEAGAFIGQTTLLEGLNRSSKNQLPQLAVHADCHLASSERRDTRFHHKFCYIGAAAEDERSQRCNRIRNSERSKAGAIHESTITKNRRSLNLHLCEAAAAFEGMASKLSGNTELIQCFTITECGVSDSADACRVWNQHTGKPGTPIRERCWQFRQLCRAQVNQSEVGASIEHTAAQRSDASGKRNGNQRGVVLKRFCADRRDCIVADLAWNAQVLRIEPVPQPRNGCGSTARIIAVAEGECRIIRGCIRIIRPAGSDICTRNRNCRDLAVRFPDRIVVQL